MVGVSGSSDTGGLICRFEARCFRISVAAGAKSSSGSSGTGFDGGGGCGFRGEEKSGKGLWSSNELRCVADFRGDCFIVVRFGVVLVKKSPKRSTCVFAVLVRGFILDQYGNQEDYFLLYW